MPVPLTRRLCLAVALTVAPGTLAGQALEESSGGPLLPEQAAYDVRYYDLAVRLHPADSLLEGALNLHADVVHPLDYLVLHLDPRLAVRAVERLPTGPESLRGRAPSYQHEGGLLRIQLPRTLQPGERLGMRILYGGRPRAGPEGSFSAFIWGETPEGRPWVTVNCETRGADLWWPVKDHPSDEPDSMSLHITVPEGLSAISNGVLRGVRDHGDGSRTFDWFVSSPINHYGVSLNVAPYIELATTFESVAGTAIPVSFWVLPRFRDQAEAALPEFLDHMRHFEELLGPYPFRAQKYGIAQTNYLGMEHQTVIAYGAEFRNDAMANIDWGFDALHQHELAHEWFGNMLTPYDFRDLWLNEGLASYAQVLYAESRLGEESAAVLLQRYRADLDHSRAVAPRESITAADAFRRDLYRKGAVVLHMLRTLVGDEDFFALLRRWSYPDPAREGETGCACRFVSTDEFQTLAEEITGRELGWFFEAYLRRPGLPRLVVQQTPGTVALRWEGLDDLPTPIPVEAVVAGDTIAVPVGLDWKRVPVPEGAEIQLDPRARLLFERVDREEGDGAAAYPAPP